MEIAPSEITELVVETAKRLVEDLNPDDRFEVDASTELFGGGQGFDSMGMMAFLLELEQSLEEKYGRKILLADKQALSESEVPFKSVPRLTNYIGRALQRPA